jgi:hypothetical protein
MTHDRCCQVCRRLVEGFVGFNDVIHKSPRSLQLTHNASSPGA